MRILVILAVAAALSGCEKPVFHESQIVRSKLTGQRGIVVNVFCGDDCIYDVRFQPFSTVRMRAFEIELDK